MPANGIVASSIVSFTAAAAGAHIARRLGLPNPLPEQRVWQLARGGVLPCIRLGRRVFFRRHDLDAWIERGGGEYQASGSNREGPAQRGASQ